MHNIVFVNPLKCHTFHSAICNTFICHINVESPSERSITHPTRTHSSLYNCTYTIDIAYERRSRELNSAHKSAIHAARPSNQSGGWDRTFSIRGAFLSNCFTNCASAENTVVRTVLGCTRLCPTRELARNNVMLRINECCYFRIYWIIMPLLQEIYIRNYRIYQKNDYDVINTVTEEEYQ